MSSTTQEQKVRKPLKGIKLGVVVSDKCDKTRKVQVNFLAKNSKYGKYLKRSTTYVVHDPGNDSHEGDRVEIAPCRPISKSKSWRVVRVIQKVS